MQKMTKYNFKGCHKSQHLVLYFLYAEVMTSKNKALVLLM